MDILYGQRTFFPKGKEKTKDNWILIDATDQVMGRLASKIAARLMGKHSTGFTPGFFIGDSVVVINAQQIKITGSKMEQKEYIWHTGYFGGLKSKKIKYMKIETVLLNAIKGMLPKNRYGRKLLTRVRVFAQKEHNLIGQSPVLVDLK